MVFDIEKVFDILLEKKLKPSRDRLFRLLIDIEFSEDLKYAQRLSAIPYYDRTSSQNFLENSLKRKYPITEKCPSILYSKVSVQLKREYNIIHRRLMEVLHPIIKKST